MSVGEKRVIASTYNLLLWMSFLESVSSISMCYDMWKRHKTCGLSIITLLLRIIALAAKYVGDQPELTLEYPEMLLGVESQYWLKILLLIALVFTFVISVCCLDHFDDKLDMWWIFGATITSLLLGVDHFIPTEKDRWMFGSYLEIIAWIPQFKLCLKMTWSTLKDSSIPAYIASSFYYDISGVFCFSYDFYRYQFYGFFGYKLIWLKFIMWFGILLKFLLKVNGYENEENEKSEDPIEVVFTVSKLKSDSVDQLSNESETQHCHMNEDKQCKISIKNVELLSPN